MPDDDAVSNLLEGEAPAPVKLYICNDCKQLMLVTDKPNHICEEAL